MKYEKIYIVVYKFTANKHEQSRKQGGFLLKYDEVYFFFKLKLIVIK